MPTIEARAGTFNTHLMFSPNETARATEQCFEANFSRLEALLGQTGEIHVLNLAETTATTPGQQPMPKRQWEMLQSGMKSLGFALGEAACSPRPDQLVDTIWAREGLDACVDVVEIGKGIVLPRVHIPGFAHILGLHNPSGSEDQRVRIAEELVAYKQRTAAARNQKGEDIVVVGDTNAASRKESATTKALHAADTVLRFAGVSNNGEVSGSLLNKAVRAAAMTRGKALKVMREGGFIDVTGNDHRATVHERGLEMHIDRMFAELLSAKDYDVVLAQDEDGRFSDHDLIAATLYAR